MYLLVQQRICGMLKESDFYHINKDSLEFLNNAPLENLKLRDTLINQIKKENVN